MIIRQLKLLQDLFHEYLLKNGLLQSVSSVELHLLTVLVNVTKKTFRAFRSPSFGKIIRQDLVPSLNRSQYRFVAKNM